MPIKYRSTRGKDQGSYQFSKALLTSTAQDGGLLVPEILPQLSLTEINNLSQLPYAQRVEKLLNKFQTDLDPTIISGSTAKAYGQNFDHTDIVPVVPLKARQYMQELWHGPTSAFKDLGLQIMGPLFSNAVILDNVKRERKGKSPLNYVVLAATSGDTGKAALEAYKDLPGVSIMVFYPFEGVSKLQELQMSTQEGTNVGIHAMRGDFDKVQKAVKETFGDDSFKELLKKGNVVLSSANSINWGRIVPQIAYHINGYVELVRKGTIHLGDKIDVAVPTGNFGNLLAAYYAKAMGLPIGKLICASNENNVLTEFLQTGVYDLRKRELVKTPSPSMDILVASNVERLLHIITGEPKKVAHWMQELKDNNVFKVDSETIEKLRDNFYAGWVSNDECLSNIRHIVDQTGYLMDPHTSVAQVITQEYQDETGSTRPIITCSTAHWAKFPKDVCDALIGGQRNHQRDVDGHDEFAALHQVTGLIPNTSIPPNIAELAGKPVIYKTVYDASKSDVQKAINIFVRDQNKSL